MTDHISYPPLNTPKQVAEGVWIVDAEPVHPGRIPLPIRMTVLRLAGGGLLLHSPVPYRPSLHRALEALGRVEHFVAPSVGHWMFLQDWQAACQNAITWAVPGLKDRGQVRRSGVRIDAELSNKPPRIWAGEIDQVLVKGPVFKEVCLFHRPSRTLLLTDLIINLEGDLLPVGPRTLARVLGIVAPNGKAPLYLRLLLRMNHREVALAAWRLVAFNPDRVIFTHGHWFNRDATSQLRRSLLWLLGPVEGERRLPQSSMLPVALPRTSTVLAAAALLGLVAVVAYRRQRRPDV
ncbi:DUF4336 domain-containing protein [Methylobacterium sp. E-041]|uniref:DUF4336 domain-containing protein n=1 Tax=Methylobacterium sp. E-041 TaxID=2836573 RepID=UPI001FBA70D3|nr:DUF4336 domain-containing protein [Methylobacterium sp. E-041]MCJ2105220.1 DUF4336 domain-containing protein [Methylobacterium sp. E-041]